MADSGRIDVRTDLVEFTYAVHRAVAAIKLGAEWRVIIERNGKPAAHIQRTRDAGVLVGFYGDVLPEEPIA